MVSLKMKATASNKGFTLVELIVVITILAILGTIGFLSLQGYSANARDSKRTSDLRSLSTSVTTQATSGVAYTAFANGTASGGLTNIALAGLAAGTVGSAYVGGIPNYTTLGVDAGKFKDPQGQDYKVGTSTLAGGIFQFAATLEAGGTPTSAVNGNYNARTTAPSTSATGTLASTVVGTPVTITIPAAAINQFKRGDTVSYGTVTTATVNSISGDGTSLTIVPSAQSASQNTTSGATLALKAVESSGLVAQKGGTATGVVDNSTTTLPY
jgi:prepilin-type N-terminal cleavage/methylation domain-containing protein